MRILSSDAVEVLDNAAADPKTSGGTRDGVGIRGAGQFTSFGAKRPPFGITDHNLKTVEGLLFRTTPVRRSVC